MTNQQPDVRWKQRFQNYLKALSQLRKFLERKELNDLEEQGLIQAFEYTYELAWNTLKDFYRDQGEVEIQGPRDTIQIAFKRGLITEGQVWMNMLQDRNRTSHTYNEETADAIVKAIREYYFVEFEKLANALTQQQLFSDNNNPDSN